jgi:hypothetical protein
MHNPAATAVEQVKAVRAERLPSEHTPSPVALICQIHMIQALICS